MRSGAARSWAIAPVRRARPRSSGRAWSTAIGRRMRSPSSNRPSKRMATSSTTPRSRRSSTSSRGRTGSATTRCRAIEFADRAIGRAERIEAVELVADCLITKGGCLTLQHATVRRDGNPRGRHQACRDAGPAPDRRPRPAEPRRFVARPRSEGFLRAQQGGVRHGQQVRVPEQLRDRPRQRRRDRR